MGTNELPSEIRRFKEIREDHDFTQSEFAEQLGIKHSTADIERGRTKLSGRVVTELLRLFHVNPLWLFGYSNQKHLTTDNGDISPKVVIVDKEDQENMILVNQKAAAGYPNNIQDVEWYQKLPAFDLPLPQYRNATYRGFQVEGDSMLPNFRPDDWVLAKGVESLDYASDNKVYVVVMQDAVVVKKLQKLPDSSKVLLVSLNEEYVPYEVFVSDIQEIWQVNSKLTFNIDSGSEHTLLRELQASMQELKSQIKNLNT
ncbi:XRE family transcriptional regulator [uncultured Dokdonia sp.]|uniref:XRE family transcriptional regulator n=1 Tax=uncultured Dokdonia sp. TaxID=575653 RepID=UPI002609252D|nr:XRE family transcriptional regulator [uncultured Dokdonia sp.]